MLYEISATFTDEDTGQVETKLQIVEAETLAAAVAWGKERFAPEYRWRAAAGEVVIAVAHYQPPKVDAAGWASSAEIRMLYSDNWEDWQNRIVLATH